MRTALAFYEDDEDPQEIAAIYERGMSTTANTVALPPAYVTWTATQKA